MIKALSMMFVMLLLVMASNAQDLRSIYNIQTTDINGKSFDMESLKGKKVLIVNTATQCSLHPQFEQLEKLYEEYKDKNFVIVAVPSNDFGNKEPGSNTEIKNYVETNYHVSFPVLEKTGLNDNPIYQYLTEKELNGTADSKVTWNFQKYMINEDGSIAGVVEPSEDPYSDKVLDWLNN